MIEHELTAAGSLPPASLRFLHCQERGYPVGLPFGFSRDRQRTLLGIGKAVFDGAQQAFERWAMFDLGWVRLVNPQARIEAGQVVAVEVHTLGLWTLNTNRILEAIRGERRFGFVYATTSRHVEEGEERFLLEFDPASGEVWYDLEAVSRPRATAARLGYPVTRHFQHKFARASHKRMLDEVRGGEMARQADTLNA